MSALQDLLRNHFGPNAFEWFDVPYIGDWLAATHFWFVAEFVDSFQVHERDFSINDQLISYSHKKQQISGYTNNVIALFVPFAIMLVASLMKRSLIDLHHGVLGLWVSRSLSHFITVFLKNRVGRLRPDFLSRCKWDEAASQCAGKLKDVIDGRKSFPSGHSSTAFSGMMFLFLWLSARTAAWSFSVTLPPRGPWIFASRIGRMFLTLLPLLFATWVAISRVEDYRHHKEDVIVGSLIGIFCAFVGYFSYWPNPFRSRHHYEGTIDQPRSLYRVVTGDVEGHGVNRGNDYELARLEDGAV